jgi:REP element-mobilizing transposase RayT
VNRPKNLAINSQFHKMQEWLANMTPKSTIVILYACRGTIIRRTAGKLWQRNYYEHVIRNEDELNHIRQYIAENPTNWRKDKENPNLQPPTIYSNTTRST